MSVALTRLFSRRKAELVMVKVRRDDLKQVCNWVTSGDIRPVVHSVFSLEKIRDAHRQQESKHTRGKIVIRI
jgi:NADPH:quinone reductase-like Zn-dependent oxidoreductase